MATCSAEIRIVEQPKILQDGSKKHLLTQGSPSVLTILDQDGPISEAGLNSPVSLPAADAKASSGAETIDERVGDWVKWGDNDDYPEVYMNTVDKLGVLRRAIDLNADMHYGAGLVWLKNEYTNDGKILRKVQKMPQWDEFAERCNFNVKLIEMIDMLETFYLAMPEVIMKDKKVVNVNILDTMRSRLSRRNGSGHIPKVFYNVHTDIPRAEVVPLDTYNPENPLKYNKFVYPVMYRCPGQLYYPEPNVQAPIRAGWGDIAIAVPKFVKSVYDNQMALKYHVTVPLSAIRAKYKNWDELGPQEQMNKLVEYKGEIDKHLTSAAAAGKSLITVYEDGQDTATIEPIKNFLDSTRELPNNVAANSELLFSMGVDPALVGMNMPGGKDLNGSGGSDKREGRKAKQANLKREREISLQLPRLIARLNGWIKPGDGVYPAYLDSDTSQTMDENPTGSQTIVS